MKRCNFCKKSYTQWFCGPLSYNNEIKICFNCYENPDFQKEIAKIQAENLILEIKDREVIKKIHDKLRGLPKMCDFDTRFMEDIFNS